jgi:DNA-binding beta-propeller fold protein YncE
MLRLHFKILLLLSALLLCGCSKIKPAAPETLATTQIVWPPAPETGRIAYVQSALRPGDMGLRQSAFTRFGHWLTGSEKGNEPFVKPFGIAVDENDNLCLTDTGANAVLFYDRSHKKWSRWQAVGPVRFGSPVAVIRRSGIFYVADSILGSIISFDENGKLLHQFKAHLGRPSGLALYQDQLFVADAQRHCVVVFDLQGNFKFEFGKRGTGPGQFNFPTHIAINSQGDLFVTDSMNSRVQTLDATGAFKNQVGQVGDSPGQFSRPKGVAVDSFGHVYIMDALADNLQIFDTSGRLLLNLGGSGAEPGQFWLPNGIAISRANEIFVADSYNHRIQVLKYIGPS